MSESKVFSVRYLQSWLEYLAKPQTVFLWLCTADRSKILHRVHNEYRSVCCNCTFEETMANYKYMLGLSSRYMISLEIRPRSDCCLQQIDGITEICRSIILEHKYTLSADDEALLVSFPWGDPRKLTSRKLYDWLVSFPVMGLEPKELVDYYSPEKIKERNPNARLDMFFYLMGSVSTTASRLAFMMDGAAAEPIETHTETDTCAHQAAHELPRSAILGAPEQITRKLQRYAIK